MNFQEKINGALKAFSDAFGQLEDAITEIDNDNEHRQFLIKQEQVAINFNNKEKERALKATKKIRSLIG